MVHRECCVSFWSGDLVKGCGIGHGYACVLVIACVWLHPVLAMVRLHLILRDFVVLVMVITGWVVTLVFSFEDETSFWRVVM